MTDVTGADERRRRIAEESQALLFGPGTVYDEHLRVLKMISASRERRARWWRYMWEHRGAHLFTIPAVRRVVNGLPS